MIHEVYRVTVNHYHLWSRVGFIRVGFIGAQLSGMSMTRGQSVLLTSHSELIFSDLHQVTHQSLSELLLIKKG